MRLLSMVFILFGVCVAQAQIVFSPAVSYRSAEVESNNATVLDSNGLVADIRVGYLHSSGLFLGGMYSVNNIDLTDDDDSGFSVGPTIGFSHYSGFYTLFTYHIMAEFELGNQSPTQKFVEGMGPQIDLGWVFPLTSSFSMGPQMTYKSITYDKIETGGVEGTQESTISGINPYISFWFQF